MGLFVFVCNKYDVLQVNLPFNVLTILVLTLIFKRTPCFPFEQSPPETHKPGNTLNKYYLFKSRKLLQE